jgi:predicted DNA repair protein MutK
MSMGLIALLDEVAAIAKAAAATVDDAVGQAARVGAKSAGVVIDDAAVTPRYVVGLDPARELPIVAKIALGSLRNKLIILLPAALLLGYVAPWAITPILMLGGAFLCYEGAEKILEAVRPHAAHAHEEKIAAPVTPEALEKRKVDSAVRTDLILSAEIMAIALAALPPSGVIQQALVLALVGIGITALVYGAVALIVRADDVGLALARDGRTSFGRAAGRALVKAMPSILTTLTVVGTAAMIWVGGGILIHGVASFGWHGPEHFIEALGDVLSAEGGLLRWLGIALGSGLVGLAVGAALIPVVEKAIAPGYRALERALGK